MWLWVLTASRLPWWPRGCKPHLPTTAKPAEGQAISQVKQYPPPFSAHQLQALRVGGARGMGSTWGCIPNPAEARRVTWSSSGLPGLPGHKPQVPQGLPGLFPAHSLVCKAPKGVGEASPLALENACALSTCTLGLKTTVSVPTSQPPTQTRSDQYLWRPPHLSLLE